jgi:hypothetical protein
MGYPHDVGFPHNSYRNIAPQQLQSAEFYTTAREHECFRVGHHASDFIQWAVD